MVEQNLHESLLYYEYNSFFRRLGAEFELAPKGSPIVPDRLLLFPLPTRSSLFINLRDDCFCGEEASWTPSPCEEVVSYPSDAHWVD